MEIVFKDSEGGELGRIVHVDLKEILIPAFRVDSFDMFLKHIFISRPSVGTWRITDIQFGVRIVEVFLKEMEHVLSLVEYAKKRNRSPESYLKPFRLVEVDFGFYSDLFDINGEKIPNTKNMGLLLAGEMHKLRPCIVLSSSNGIVQVIPLTTKTDGDDDPLKVQMSASSFLPLAARYAKKPSCALLGMIQSVSINRVMPPRAKSGKYENNYEIYSISSSDKERIKLGLATQYNQSLALENDLLKRRSEGLGLEKARLLQALTVERSTKQAAEQECDKLAAFILLLGKDLGMGTTVEEIIAGYTN